MSLSPRVSNVDLHLSIENRVLAPLGAPILPVELAPSDEDARSALYKYYSHLPIKLTRQYFFRSDREERQDIKELLNLVETPAKPDDYFYVGVGSFATRNQIGESRFDEYLLGMNVGVPSYRPDVNVVQQTILDINVGDVYYEENLHLDKPEVRWVVGGSSYLSVVYFLGSYKLSSIPVRHFELFCDLVSQVYLERLIAIRSTGSFNLSDFKISNDAIDSYYKKCTDRLNDTLSSISIVSITRG